ncbi:hypothetical protein BDZ97DRAFT_1921419 [Flammula alnicola]|nr:hypothetical protein BDZ97DRAFT_1921419 [Flammula alnicola]
MPQHVPAVYPDISDTVRTNYVGFASFIVLIWDHIDTFTDEVELIWKGKRKGLFVYLFLFNRYFTPLGFIINSYGAYTPCKRSVQFVTFVLSSTYSIPITELDNRSMASLFFKLETL